MKSEKEREIVLELDEVSKSVSKTLDNPFNLLRMKFCFVNLFHFPSSHKSQPHHLSPNQINSIHAHKTQHNSSVNSSNAIIVLSPSSCPHSLISSSSLLTTHSTKFNPTPHYYYFSSNHLSYQTLNSLQNGSC